ncbi:preprotein translocase subunit SecD [Prevotella pectinovora]|uniref:protein translocase subunit SecDF n=1 Tax=Prevotella sp. LMAG:51 TaxID=1969564 RepID=UPI0005B6C094|nr:MULTISPECIES: protein translocase subunit SecDF [Prevotella]KIP56110.1 preprotein translocase subunit SecD [Prevotella pectinovora]KIP58007.1 preprotein translocase subunit SecD [Prevotella pectinovora]KIP62375.1 preprotein translocase subunit SecD [Prevotella pectinovora]MCI6047792.1 protein translocase subunit SecDF [Prevotella pectinovora]MDD7743533.1 protein translocase subunit SecDF [Prevotella pectinovora]
MQNKGIVIVLAVLMTLASIFYLSFSVATNYYDSEAAKIKDPIAQQDYKDSVKYLGIYSYQRCLETQIGLGLDLKGGMNVILEISVPDVVETLADHKTDAAFVKSMEQAKKEEETSQSDFISLFIKYYRQNAPGHRLAEIFATQQLKGQVSTQSSDKEVEKALRSQVQSAIDNSYNVVRNRIDKFGVVQPNIQKLEGQEGRIMVEMPGVREPERVRKLLQGSANLEFWETYNSEEITPYLRQLDQTMANGGEVKKDTAATEKKDDAAEKAEVAEKTSPAKLKVNANKNSAAKAAASSESAQMAQAKKTNPLLAVLQLAPQGSLSVVGYANVRDTAAVNKIIYSAAAKQVLPSDLKLLWGAKPADGLSVKNVYELYALKVTQSNGHAPLEGDVITDAKDEFDQMSNRPSVSMSMNSDGARRWAEMTKANINKAIAIVLDGAVYSAPRVNGEISGGNSQITGNFTIEDTKDLANTLKSGRMPAPARIVQEDVVGPTLGAQSIQQGLISFAVAFILLMLYMVLMYDFIPGMMANFALLVNLFFTLGILTSFQAALTMPGIAGIVLTLGMAVDANVLIYERTKEELRKGKALREAIKAGYGNAFSAIFDSNLTSIITGVILFVFGTGPVRGFATTLIIGICCSFFTAVYLTRLVYENRLAKDKWLKQNFTTRLSRNFLQNNHVGFMNMYKKTFTIVGILIAVFVVSFFVRGLSKSIDFTGGRNYVVKLEKAVEPEDVSRALQTSFPNSSVSALALGTDHKTIRISTNYKIESNSPTIDDEVEEILFKALSKEGMVTQKSVEAFKNPDVRAGGSIISSAKVGPSVAKDITYGAIISVIFALIAIFLYILLRFRNLAFSLGASVALAIDTVVVLGFYSLLWNVVPFSLEIDQTFIGAILTVIGYSINDKVVVFDRIRENLGLYKKRDFFTIFNNSLNETLARTVNTSLTTLIVLLCIFILGGDNIRSFAFAMILGVIFGTLSSIFVAAPIAYMTLSRRDKGQRGDKAIEEMA